MSDIVQIGQSFEQITKFDSEIRNFIRVHI